MPNMLPIADAVFPLAILPEIPDISADALRVLIVLVAARRWEYTNLPTVDEIAETTGQNKAVIKKAISELIDSETIWTRHIYGVQNFTIPQLESYYGMVEHIEMSHAVENRVYEILAEVNRGE